MKGLLGLANPPVYRQLRHFWSTTRSSSRWESTYMVYGILRATLLGFFFEEDDEETDIAGPIVIADNGAVAEVFGPPPRVIAPREREGGGQG